MKRFGTIFPFLEKGLQHPHVGRLVANAEFARALLQYGRFDEYVFGSPSRRNLEAFEKAVNGWVDDDRRRNVRYVAPAEWPQMLSQLSFQVVHLGGWGYFMPGLHYLRCQEAPELWPLTGVMHSLHGRDTIDHAVRLASAELLPCDAVFCTSRDGATAMRHLLDGAEAIVGRRFQGRLEQLPLGVADELVDVKGERSKARQRLRIPEAAGVVLALGRLSTAGKFDPVPLCRAFAERIRPLVRRDIYLVFAGGAEPADLERTRSAARHFGIADQVRFHANFPATQKANVLAMADLVAAPADNVQETFGLVLLEAQAAGVPVVASRYDGYKDLVRDGTDGYLIDTWQAPLDPLAAWFDVMDGTVGQLVQSQGIAVDMHQFAARTVELLNDADLRERMGEAGRAKVDREYRWSRVVARYEAVWDELATVARGCERPAPARNPYALGPSIIFPHYASHTLQSDTVVAATTSRVDYLPVHECAGWLTTGVLQAILGAARQPIEAGQLISIPHVTKSQAWFAIAWLLKHGFLRHQPHNRPLQEGPRPAD